VVRRAQGDWLMWAVNSGPEGCTSSSTTVELRRSTDGVTWSDPVTTDLSEGNLFAWHIDVQWIPSKSEFWATYNVKVPGSCTTSALHFARSADGTHWNIAPGAVLVRGATPAFSDIVYRASLLYDAPSDNITLWYSGASFADSRYTWRIATETLTASEFFERGSLGYSATTRPGEFDGMELQSFGWRVEPVSVTRVESSFFEDRARFPAGSIEFDSALLMRDIPVIWHRSGRFEASVIPAYAPGT
jgi:hypothetical protein